MSANFSQKTGSFAASASKISNIKSKINTNNIKPSPAKKSAIKYTIDFIEDEPETIPMRKPAVPKSAVTKSVA